MANKTLYKSMLYAVQTVSESVKEKAFNDELIHCLEKSVAPIIQFFSLPLPEAIVLCYFIDAHLKDQTVNKESIITHFGKDITFIADVDEYIDNLAKRKLIFLTQPNRRIGRQFKEAHLNPKVSAAMAEGDPSVMNIKPSTNFVDFLLEVNDFILLRINQHITTEELQYEINNIIEINKSIREIKWLRKQKTLKGLHLLVFLNICVEQSQGEEDVDIEKMVSEVIDKTTDRMLYKQSIKSDQCPLFKENYVVHTNNLFGIMSMVQLSDETMNKLFKEMGLESKQEFNPRMGKFITTDKISDEKLFYNHREQEQIHTLSNALQGKNYNALIERMKKNNMTPGFTVLMYGYPGTGKTSTVKAIAKATGRHIFMVDIPKINSKWVGESEKNLSRLFDEYRRAKKVYSPHPILLFNEADAILGKRISSNSSVDKMNNSLQNILLQELEDFEGIFMATTNLVDHLDPAFDRRLLYKIEYKKPEQSVRYNIIRNSFPELDDEFIESINKNYHLTGGQISNIRKKMLIKNLLNESFNMEEELMVLCEEENSLRSYARPQIGFHSK